MDQPSPKARRELMWNRRELFRRSYCAMAGTLVAPSLLYEPFGVSKGLAAPNSKVADPVTLRAVSFRGAPDGRERQIWGYNGQFPGPTIRVKEAESLRIRVVNELGVPTSIHWHGMHQPGSWRMDGVAGVSGPPIAPGAEFTYEFTATPAGTHWYHSHTGVQYGDGLYGPLIVEERTSIARYDRDEILMVSDWFLEAGDLLLDKVLKGGMMKMTPSVEGKSAMEMKDRKDVGDVPFQSGLFNGRGRAQGNANAPLTVVEVRNGETIRLRLINASSTYAFRIQIEGHPLTVIATDGAPIKPVVVDQLVLSNGERYDVLLEAKQRGAHWIRASTLDGNEFLAILRYADAPRAVPESKPGSWSKRALTPDAMRSPAPVALAAQPRVIPLRRYR